MSVVLGLIREPDHPNIILKISKEAAKGTLLSIFYKLLIAKDRYPLVEPRVAYNPETTMGEPKLGNGFNVKGRDIRDARNPSVYAASINAPDLQGRRGRTHIDDVETEREAKYIAYREKLEGRLYSASRTIERREHYLWAMFGTPQHGDSVMFKLPNRLKNLGDQFKIFRFPVQDENGKPLWEEGMRKAELHRRLLSPQAWRVAYMLEPVATSRLDQLDLVAIQDQGYPFCHDRAAFEHFLDERYQEHRDWIREKAHWYIGYDPSGSGDFAMCVLCFIGQEFYLVDAVLEPGDSYNQMTYLKGLWQRYGHPETIIERNGQQQSFMDMARMVLGEDSYLIPHLSSSQKESEQIGIPALLAEVKAKLLHVPYADQRGINVSDYLLIEMEQYYAGSHTHLLPALWFAWHWHRKNVVQESIKEMSNRVDHEVYSMVRNGAPNPLLIDYSLRSPSFSGYKSRAMKAWQGGRKWR